MEKLFVLTSFVVLCCFVILCFCVGCAITSKTTHSKVKPNTVEKEETFCKTCDSVEIRRCYWTLATAIKFPIYNENTFKLVSDFSISHDDEGCRCTVFVNGYPFVSTEVMPKYMCSDKVPHWLRK